MFETRKVLDTGNVPKSIRQLIRDYINPNNDSFIYFKIKDPDNYSTTLYSQETIEKAKKLDDWLLENGCEPNEEIIILVWW